MRSAKRKKRNPKREIHHKKPAPKKKRSGLGISMADREHINHAVYYQESNRAGEGTWRVQPKDSIEVHKDRRRRKDGKENKKHKREASNTCQSCRCRAQKRRCSSSCSTFTSNSYSDSYSSYSS